MMERVGAVLVLASDSSLVSTLCGFAEERAWAVHQASNLRDAEQCFSSCSIDVAIVELSFSEEETKRLIDLFSRQPRMPQVVIISDSPAAAAAFRLAQAGARGLAPKSLHLKDLARLWDDVLRHPPDLRPLLRASVGRVPLAKMVELVRRSMTEEALVAAGSSRRRASALLGISRQLLHYTLRAGVDRSA